MSARLPWSRPATAEERAIPNPPPFQGVKRCEDGVYRTAGEVQAVRAQLARYASCDPHEFSPGGFCLGCGRTRNEIAIDDEEEREAQRYERNAGRF